MVLLHCCDCGRSPVCLRRCQQHPNVAGQQAWASNISISNNQPGASPFINFVSLTGNRMANLAAVEFSIAPKPDSVSKPVDVRYAIAGLVARGYASLADNRVDVPIFGLYAGYANQVSLWLQFKDGSTLPFTINLITAPYADSTGLYDKPTIIKQRVAGSALGLDFFYMKSAVGSPVVVDTDAEIRWVVLSAPNSSSSTYQDGEFVIGDAGAPTVYRLQLGGTIAQGPLQSATYTMFHHNIDPGKRAASFNYPQVSDRCE
jgi:arylsulfate sulfotransferase